MTEPNLNRPYHVRVFKLDVGEHAGEYLSSGGMVLDEWLESEGTAGFVSGNVLPTPNNPFQPPAPAGVEKGNPENQSTQPPYGLTPGGLIDSSGGKETNDAALAAVQARRDKEAAEREAAAVPPPCMTCGEPAFTPEKWANVTRNLKIANPNQPIDRETQQCGECRG